MPGMPVSIGCPVTLNPGAAGAPDIGAITVIPPPQILAGALPLATAGSTCQMINSVTGVPYPIVIPPTALGASTVVKNGILPILRLGDNIVLGPAILTIGLPGPPVVVPFINDLSPP